MLWKPAFFGVKPSLILKGGMIAAARDGRPERVDPHAAAGALPADVRRVRHARSTTSVTFVSKAALENPARRASSSSRKPLVAVKNTRKIGKKDMKLNDATPHIDVDPETYEVRADGELLMCEPATSLPLAQRYFLF